MNYVISFSDVMAAIVPIVIGILGFLIKNWFHGFETEIKEIKEHFSKNNERLHERIDHLEKGTDEEIDNLKQSIGDIKGDFATTFVLREDFFRAMNGIEDRVRGIDNKIDRLLMQSEK